MFSFQSSVQCSRLLGGELPRISLNSQLASVVPACGSVGQSTVIDQFSFPWNRGSYPQELPGLYVLAHPHQGKQLIHVLTAKYYEGGSSFMITTSSTCKSLLGRVHFRRYCKLSRNSFLQRDQNSFAKCWTRLQRFLQYTSAG